MKRKILRTVSMLICIVMAVSLAGCGKIGGDASSDLFEEMPKHYVFSSGAGAWATEFDLNSDGTFTGKFHDADMGVTGDEYPNGTVSICNFSGKFSTPIKVNDYTYSMKLEELNTEGMPGEEYYEDKMRYVYSEPYSFDDADEFLIYLPGAKLADLPDDFVGWLAAFLNINTTNELPFYGIYNAGGKQGFVAFEGSQTGD